MTDSDRAIRSEVMRVRLKAFFACILFAILMYCLLVVSSKAKLQLKPSAGGFQIGAAYGGYSLLQELGFVLRPRLFPQAYHDDENIPVVITAAGSTQFSDLMLFLESLRKFFPEKRLVVYNLGLTDSQREQVTAICRCQIRLVRWDRFPKHVRRMELKAFKPIIVQEALMEFGGIFWCDPLTTFSTAELALLVNQAKRVGVVSWPLVYPTSALTHPSMFQYFNTSAEKYHFHRTVDTAQFILYNVESVHKELMLPWVKCALDINCIAPSGAKRTGCSFDQKPKYKFARCHQFELSAFNVLLGPMYNFEMPYVALLDIFVMQKPRTDSWWPNWNFTLFNWLS